MNGAELTELRRKRASLKTAVHHKMDDTNAAMRLSQLRPPLVPWQTYLDLSAELGILRNQLIELEREVKEAERVTPYDEYFTITKPRGELGRDYIYIGVNGYPDDEGISPGWSVSKEVAVAFARDLLALCGE